MTVSIKTIAPKADVSLSTVSRALRDDPRISSKTRQAVQTIALELGYLPSQVARSLELQRTQTLGVVVTTITHRVRTGVFEDRGVRVDRTNQLNFGGNTDFQNMLERERLQSKKISKTQAVTNQLDDEIEDRNVHVGPSDYIPWLDDRKWCHIRMDGTTFGDVPLNLKLKLEVWDSPNSAGVVIDAIRCAKLGMDRGLAGALFAPSSYFIMSPLEQYTDHVACRKVEAFIAGEENQTQVERAADALRI